MAVYTEVSDTDLEAFLGDYDLGRLLAYKGIAEGVENSNFFVHAEAGFFILTLYEKRVEAKDLPYFLGLMEHLAKHGLNCPQPVKTKAGALFGKLAGSPAAIVTFLEGVSSRRPTRPNARRSAKRSANCIRPAPIFPASGPMRSRVEAWPKLYRAGRSGSESVRLASRNSRGELGFLKAHWPRDLPHGVIHADLFPDNVLFLGDRVSGLIDFYFACNDFSPTILRSVSMPGASSPT